MRNLFISIVFLCFVATAVAQPKLQRRIYLWDVTLSMKGYGGASDIYDEVRDFLIQDIRYNIRDENTEIVVLPFQEFVLERWIVKADEAGKNDIIRRISSYNNKDVTSTNIVTPIKEVKESIIRNDRENLFLLLTDGTQSRKFGGRAELDKEVRTWAEYARINDATPVYVMLTPEARGDLAELEPAFKAGGWTLVTDFIILRPQNPVTYNIIDDTGQPASVVLTSEGRSGDLPNITIRVHADENDYITVNQEAVVRNGRFSFNVVFKQPESVLRELFPEKTRIPLRLELVNQDEMMRGGSMVSLNPYRIELELINKPEKILRIYYEE